MTTGMVFPQEQANKNEAPALGSKVSPTQEQEGSAEESVFASHKRDRFAVLNIKGQPRQVSDLGRQEQEAPLVQIGLASCGTVAVFMSWRRFELNEATLAAHPQHLGGQACLTSSTALADAHVAALYVHYDPIAFQER